MTTPLRVLHVLEALEGGTARHVVDLVRWTPGVEQHVAIPRLRVHGATDETAVPALQRAGATVHHLDMTRSPTTRENAKALRQLSAIVAEVAPDIVHAHSSIGGLLGRLAARRHRVPAIYTPNGMTDVRAGIMVERSLIPWTNRFLAVSESEADRVVELRVAPRERITVIPNGLDTSSLHTPIDLRAQLGLPADAPVVGTVSRFVHQKDPLSWVRMASIVLEREPRTHFVMIGDGELRRSAVKASVSQGLAGRLHIVPYLVEAAGALASFDVFVLSSLFEGLPYAPMEAMIAGVPVVLTDVAGSHDLVEHGENGLLAPPNDPEALAEQVLGVLGDHELAERIGRAGEKAVLERFDVETMARSVARVYREIGEASPVS